MERDIIRDGTIILATAIIMAAMELLAGWKVGFLDLAVKGSAVTIVGGTIVARIAYAKQNFYLQKRYRLLSGARFAKR